MAHETAPETPPGGARPDAASRLVRALTELPAAVAVYDGPDHVFVAASEAYRRIVAGRDLIGRPLRDVLPELGAQGFLEKMNLAFATGETVRGSGVRADWDDDGDGRIEEHYIDFTYQPLADPDGSVWGVVAYVADVTARHLAERELERARRAAEAGQARAAFLADASRLLAASLDYADTLRNVARSAVPALADWCAVDVLEDPASSAWPPAVERLAVVHQDPERVAWARALERERPPDWDAPTGLPHVLRTGETEFYPVVTDEMMVAAARDAEELALLREIGFVAYLCVALRARGRVLGAITLVMTESGRRYEEDDRALAEELARRAAVAMDHARLYAAEQEARADAEAASRAKSEFLAVMSHELRTPMNAVLGYLDLLDAGVAGELTEGQRGYVARVAASGRHLLGLIEEVLAFSRLEAGREEAAFALADAGEVARDAAALVEPLARARGLDFRVEAEEAPGEMVTDAGKLRQVLVNLLGNAVKFTDRGEVVLSVRPAAGGAVEFAVRDTGIGIAPGVMEKIFEPFWQADTGPTRRAGGTGLGLAVSRELASRLGGDVAVRSEPGRGSTFTVTLPRVPPGPDGGPG